MKARFSASSKSMSLTSMRFFFVRPWLFLVLISMNCSPLMQKLEELADLISMSPTSCSRFFRTHANRTITDYITDVRLGNAVRALVDTTESVSVICYNCGFNNLSNFNRIFKEKKGMTPRDFRQMYKKTKIII